MKRYSAQETSNSVQAKSNSVQAKSNSSEDGVGGGSGGPKVNLLHSCTCSCLEKITLPNGKKSKLKYFNYLENLIPEIPLNKRTIPAVDFLIPTSSSNFTLYSSFSLLVLSPSLGDLGGFSL